MFVILILFSREEKVDGPNVVGPLYYRNVSLLPISLCIALVVFVVEFCRSRIHVCNRAKVIINVRLVLVMHIAVGARLPL